MDGLGEHGRRTIWLQVDAPAKPAAGQACNGCGVCCAAEPCPVARVFLSQRHGACRALVWVKAERQYRCGMLLEPSNYLRLLPVSWQAWFRRLIARWIAAGTVCDSDAEALHDSKGKNLMQE